MSQPDNEGDMVHPVARKHRQDAWFAAVFGGGVGLVAAVYVVMAAAQVNGNGQPIVDNRWGRAGLTLGLLALALFMVAAILKARPRRRHRVVATELIPLPSLDESAVPDAAAVPDASSPVRAASPDGITAGDHEDSVNSGIVPAWSHLTPGRHALGRLQRTVDPSS
jgi:hypothetical protein